MQTFIEQTKTGIPKEILPFFETWGKEKDLDFMYNSYLNSLLYLPELKKQKKLLPLELCPVPLSLLLDKFKPKTLPKPSKTYFEALKPAMGKDHLRPNQMGMAVYDGFCFATDAHILFKIKTEDKQRYFVKTDGATTPLKKVNEKWHSEELGNLPGYEHVIPSLESSTEQIEIDILKVYPIIASISDWAKSVLPKNGMEPVCFIFGVPFSIPLFSRFLETFIRLGEKKITLHHHGKSAGPHLAKGHLGKKNEKATGIIMPVYIKDDILSMPYINISEIK